MVSTCRWYSAPLRKGQPEPDEGRKEYLVRVNGVYEKGEKLTDFSLYTGMLVFRIAREEADGNLPENRNFQCLPLSKFCSAFTVTS